jgi:hypothetical protein
MRLDFFARRAHYLDHLAPVWNALPAAWRGTFHIAQELEPYARQELQEPQLEIFEGGIPSGDNPILTAAYGDLNKVIRNPDRKIITIEHGVTQGFRTASYPNGTIGNRDQVDLALLPNEYVAKHFRAARQTRCEVVGTPKMDPWFYPPFFDPDRSLYAQFYKFSSEHKPLIAIAFHWGSRNEDPPESGSAWEYYRAELPKLAKHYNLLGHSHPLATSEHREVFERAGIDWVGDFREVLRRADVYVNDLSSTMYEFLLTGRPVVVLNAPWFRRDVQWGIRFWDYSDVGITVESPGELFGAIDQTLREYGAICAEARRRAVADLYPYAGHSASRAAQVLIAYLEELETEHVPLSE